MQTRYFRENLRLRNFDYRSNHAYFVTIVTADRTHAFGKIINDTLRPTQRGLIAERAWHDLPAHHPFVELDAFVLMPNHLHGILFITGNDPPPGTTQGLTPHSIGAVVGSYKSAVTRTINRLRPGAARRLWQPNYYEHVIRDDRSMDRIRQYIESNPLRWSQDAENDRGTRADDVNAFARMLRADERARPVQGDAGVAATAERRP